MLRTSQDLTRQCVWMRLLLLIEKCLSNPFHRTCYVHLCPPMYLYISLCFGTRLLGRLWFPRSTKSYEEVTLHSHPGPLSLQQHTISSVTFSHPWTDSTDSQHQVVDSDKQNGNERVSHQHDWFGSNTGLQSERDVFASFNELTWVQTASAELASRLPNTTADEMACTIRSSELKPPISLLAFQPVRNMRPSATLESIIINYWWLSLRTLLIFWSGRLNDAVCKMVPVICGAANMRAVIIPHPSTCVFHSVPHDDTAQLSMEWFKGKSWNIDHLQEGFYPHGGVPVKHGQAEPLNCWIPSDFTILPMLQGLGEHYWARLWLSAMSQTQRMTEHDLGIGWIASFLHKTKKKLFLW